MIYGVDTSFANGTCDWDTAARDERVRFAYSRVCYGSIPADDDGPAFTRAHDACKRLKVPFGAYIFWLAWQDGVEQAQLFLQQADGRYGENSAVVDVEEGSGLHGWGASLEARIENLGKTLDTIEKTCGEPLIYTNRDTWSTYFENTDAFSGHRLWLAEYGTPPGQAVAIPGFKTIVAHQFSDGTGQSPIVGLSKPDNNVDRDVVWDLRAIAR